MIRGATRRFVCCFQFPIEERRTFCKTVRKTVGYVSFLSPNNQTYRVDVPASVAAPEHRLPIRTVLFWCCFVRVFYFLVHCVPPLVVWRAGTLFLGFCRCFLILLLLFQFFSFDYLFLWRYIVLIIVKYTRRIGCVQCTSFSWSSDNRRTVYHVSTFYASSFLNIHFHISPVFSVV